MGAVVRRIGDYLLLLVLVLALIILPIVAETDYSYNPAAFASSLALYMCLGLIVAGVWFNIVWESEDDD